jgi:hypothetical protein
LPGQDSPALAHAALYRGVDPERTIPDLLDIHEDAIRNHPRTLQTRIGPSSLGSECDRCLIRELAGLDREDPEDAPWLPTLGHAAHDWLEGNIVRWLMETRGDRWVPEGKVKVGTVGGVDITGNSDVLDVHSGTVVDYKLVGTTTLRKVRKAGATLTYRNQAQCYGKGWEDGGFVIKSVAIWFLPRNGFRMSDGHIHQEHYNRAMAERAIARADMFARAIQQFGVEVVLAKAPPHTGTEFSCPDPKAEEKVQRQLDGLIVPTQK